MSALLAVVIASGPALATDVHGDDAADRYVGTGGLLLPGSFDRNTRHRVAGCAGCRWRLSVPCTPAPTPPGTLMPGQSPASTCSGVVRGCPHGQLLRTWFEPAAGTWSDLGLACYEDGRPATVADLAARVRAAFAVDLPALAPVWQPRGGVLAQIPVVFSSGQPEGPFTAAYSLFGESVEVRAEPRWSWQFGDGGDLETDRPGGSYPDMSVSHPYRRAGRFPVAVSAAWSATFSLAGVGEFPVPEVVRQEATATVAVGEGRAVLAIR